MLRPALFIITLVLVSALPSQDAWAARNGVLSRCPTVARLSANGEIHQLGNPNFEDLKAARRFAGDCAKIVEELSALPALPALPRNYAEIRRQAVFASEFMTGDVYLLATSDVKSVVKLREWVKIPPPPGFIYVRKYASTSSMPPEVAEIFGKLAGSGDKSHVRGVNIQGRYVALLETEYHDELVDTLAHELVHAYLTVASGVDLPVWFQEGAAVYFSTGKESKLYGKTGDPRMKQVTIPENYKTKLYSFQHIERKVGRKKLFEFIRESVETGEVDPRGALGLGPRVESDRRPIWQAVVLVVVVAVAIFALWYRSSRSEGWVD